MLIASVILIPFCIYKMAIVKTKWVPLLVVGLLGNGLPAFLFAKAQTVIDSSLSGMLNTLTPVSAIMISIFFFRTRVSGVKLLGVLIGLVGALGLISFGADIDLNSKVILFSMYAAAGTLCYAIAVNIIREGLKVYQD